MQSAKETAANMAASAKSGMDKTKASVQEKVEKMTAHNPAERAMATEKKEERKNEAELNKLEAREHNAAAKQAAKVGGHSPGYTATGTEAYTGSTGDYLTGTGTGSTGTATYSTTGDYGRTTGGHQMSAMPGHGTGQPTGGQLTEGVMETHPIGVDTGTGRTAAHNPRAGGNPAGPGYGTGATGTYS